MLSSLKKLIQAKESRQIIQFLEDHPEVIDQKDEKGTSGFFLLLYSGEIAAFNKAKELKKEFDFFEAIVCGKLDLVKEQLSRNQTLLNEHSADGFTPIALAAFFNQTAIAHWLLSKGADPDLKAENPSQVNALHAAVAKENIYLIQAFLEKGSDPNIAQAQGVTPLHSAAHKGKLAIVQLLLDHGANVSQKMDNGDDAYSIAMRDGYPELAELLKNKA